MFVLLYVLLGAAIAGSPPVDQAALDTWWSAAARMWTTDAAYRAEGTEFTDGVCSARFDSGILVPVWSGKPPVSERMIGAVFVGEGTLTVRFPMRADAWRIANHLVRRLGRDPADLLGLAHQDEDLTIPITRGMILSADTKVKELFYELDPVGGGAILRPGANGVDEEYVITETRGKLKAKVVAGNLLPGRRLQLQRAGLDPRAMIRQDRLLSEELGLPGELLRLVADFRTSDRFHVAQRGNTLGVADTDQWVTCFRDGLDQTGTGFRTVAFAHGTDHDGVRHFQRFSGELAARGDNGGALVYGMEPVQARARITTEPKQRGNYREVDVDSHLTLRARGGPVQWVGLRVPVPDELPRSWALKALTLADGTPLAWVGLTADISGAGSKTTVAAPGDVADAELPDQALDTTDGASDGDQATAVSTDLEENPAPDGTTGEEEGVEGQLVPKTRRRYEILVLLPRAVAEGETVEVRLHWKALWQFSNYSNAGRYMGPTTGARPFLPELLPSPGGTTWNLRAEVGMPPPGMRAVSLAITGDTLRKWQDGEGWAWQEVQARGARHPALAIGRWADQDDPAAAGMPAVRVHLFPADSWGLTELPPEARRVVSWLERFLPDYPLQELELFQGPSLFASNALSDGLGDDLAGLVNVQRVASPEVGDAAVIDNENPHLMQTSIARQVAWQVWGEQVSPLSGRDSWALGALAEAYAAFYERSVYGNEAYEERMKAVRASIEDPARRTGRSDEVRRWRRDVSLTGGTDLSDVPGWLRTHYGLYVLADMVRLRIGDGAYFAALDQLARDHSGGRLSTRDVRLAFETASGHSLVSFFDYWVDGGFIPELTLEYSIADGKVSGCVRTDIPFGVLDVPVSVTDEDGSRTVTALVDVVDGKGAFEVPGRQGNPAVALDPMGFVLAYSRKVEKVAAAPCVVAVGG